MSGLLRGVLWQPEVAVDVGTATTRVATGAHLMTTPSVAGDRDVLRCGVVVDREAAVAVLEPLLARARGFGIRRPRVVVCAPTDANAEERERLRHSVSHAGASDVVLVPEPLAAAVGSGIDVASPYAQMIVDIGEGVTDCAVIRAGKIIETAAVRIGCGKLRGAVASRGAELGVNLSSHDAEELVRKAGVKPRATAALRDHQTGRLERGGNCSRVQEAVEPVVQKMIATVVSLLRELPHSVGCEIIDSGIYLTGGGAVLPGMRERMETETNITTVIVPDPFNAVVEGARAMLPIVAALNQWKH